MNGSVIYSDPATQNYYISFCKFISISPNTSVYLNGDEIKILLENNLFENCTNVSVVAGGKSVVQQCNSYQNSKKLSYMQGGSLLNYAKYLSINDCCDKNDMSVIFQAGGLFKFLYTNFTRNHCQSSFLYLTLENNDGKISFSNFVNNKNSYAFIVDSFIDPRNNYQGTNYNKYNNFIDNKCENGLIFTTKYYFENCIFDKNDVPIIFYCNNDNYPIYVVNSFVSNFSKEGNVIDVNITDDRNQYDVKDVVFVSQTLICSFKPQTFARFDNSFVCQLAFQSIANAMLNPRRKMSVR